MAEYIDILTPTGEPTGTRALKDEAHRQGWFHQTVHVWFFNRAGDILFQQRGWNKETYPGFWDVSVAGHVMAGETVVDAAIREVDEEIGIAVDPGTLHHVDVRKNINKHPNGIVDCEFQNVFLSELMYSLSELTIQEEEVDGITLLSASRILYEIEHPDTGFNLVPADYSYYKFVIEQVQRRLIL